MRIADILRHKGQSVITVRPDATVREVLAELAEHNIGALVVSPDSATIAGIVSERDVVRQLHEHGVRSLDEAVTTIMTAEVHTCGPDARVDDLRRTMTKHRIRHLPVVADGRLAGIVSIGDVVKVALDELETEREHLVEYIQS